MTVRVGACWKRHRAVVEQVHEVGVVAEFRVELDRVGFDLCACVDGAGGGCEDEIEAFDLCIS